MRQDIQRKLDAWIAQKGATVAPLPYNEIAFREIVRRGVWRLPPFTGDPKAKEKGFRDALILESVASYFEKDTSDAELVFITNDDLLQKAAMERLSANARFHHHPDAEAFFGDLRLTLQTQTRKFHNAVQRAATDAFTASFVTAKDLATKLFAPDTRAPPGEVRDFVPLEEKGEWLVDDDPRATFEGKKQGRWLWRSRIYYRRKFRRNLPTPILSASQGVLGTGVTSHPREIPFLSVGSYLRGIGRSEEDYRPFTASADPYVYTISFEISWSCLVEGDIKIMDVRIDDAQIADERVTGPTSWITVL